MYTAGTKQVAPLPALTGLRFIAALAIFLSHYKISGGAGTLSRMAGAGYVGVTFFFILSGFVISYNYLDVFERNVSKNTPRYLLARFARVYPLYIFLIVYAWLAGGASASLLPYLLAAQAWSPDINVAYGIIGPAWSISVEAFLYLSFPLIIIFFRKVGILQSASKTLMAGLIIMLVMTSLPLEFVLAGNGGNIHSFFLPSSSHRWLYRFPLARVMDFMLGILAAIYLKRFIRRADVRIKTQLSVLTWVSIVAVLLMMSSEGLFYRAFGWDAAYALPFTFIILGFAVNQTSPLARVLSCKPMILLGESSFAFYLVHTMIYELHTSAGIATHTGTFYLMFLMMAISLSVGLHVVIEKPCRNFILALGRSRRARPVTQTVAEADQFGRASAYTPPSP